MFKTDESASIGLVPLDLLRLHTVVSFEMVRNRNKIEVSVAIIKYV
jgi:hypothetical protein